MPEQRNTGEQVLSESTRLDLKTAVMLGGLAVGLAVSWGQVNLSMVKMDSELRATIIASNTKAEREASYVNGLQDARVSVMENRMENIQATTCAIDRKLDVPSVGCSQRRDP